LPLQQSAGWAQNPPVGVQQPETHVPAQLLLQQSLAAAHVLAEGAHDEGQEPSVFLARDWVAAPKRSAPLGPSPDPLSAVTRNQ
jgi:hypothetical protein